MQGMMSKENKLKTNLFSARQSKVAFAALLVVAGVLYALISLVNHYLFKTYTLDLGLYTHAMYDYVHFCVDDCSLFKLEPQSILSDHFDLYLVILSPLVLLFGSYTLLLVQIAAVLLGGWGIYKLIGLYTDDEWLPVLASAVFFFSFGVIHPFSFDYHSNVLTAMIFPWLLYFLKKENYGLTTLMVVLFVIGKENMSLWLLFVVIGLMWDYRKDRKALWHLVAYAVFSAAYFFVINMIVMPKLGGMGGGFGRYAYLGDNYVEIATNLITHPKFTFKLLFTSVIGLEEFPEVSDKMRYMLSITIANPEKAGIKEEFYACLLATGLVFTILKPNYLFMLLPLLGQKMLALQPNFWGVSMHYSVEFMPVLVVSSFLLIIKIKRKVWRLALAFALLLSTLLTTFYTVGVPKSLVLPDRVCVYQGRHYEQEDFDVAYARELLAMIPDDASVCASMEFVPRLVFRDKIQDFTWSYRPQTDYVLITDHYFGMRREGKLIFSNRDEYDMVATDGRLFLFQRRQP